VSGSAIGWKRIQRVNRDHGERFVHAWTSNSPPYGWLCLRHDGSAATFNPATGVIEPVEDPGTSTQHLLRERRETYPGSLEWLAELDERHAAISTPEEGTPR